MSPHVVPFSVERFHRVPSVLALQVSWPRGEAAKGESHCRKGWFMVEAFRRLMPFDRIIPSTGMVSCTSRGASQVFKGCGKEMCWEIRLFLVRTLKYVIDIRHLGDIRR